ncbi:MAG TPA: type IV pilus twitching motility protein PilT [Candidatus Krumholzibacteria bacterium]|nr:type IV pilus twitching motility protein PilT [Candidatus Krumholzibacteria bacterium]
MISLRELLEDMMKNDASDLHLTAGLPPMYRVDGHLMASRFETLSPEETRQLAYSVLNDEQKKTFENNRELDLSFGVQGMSRFRANVYVQRGVTTMAVRKIPYEILDFHKLGLPPAVKKFAELPRGLVLVTGPTGSGKTTTLASVIDFINQSRKAHILTIEDPIEYVHHHKGCMVNQREIKSDTETFVNALKYVLRQDPDVILVGEMRDRETIASAITIAETGHLCLATLHTNSTFESINRIVDVFPSAQQPQIRAQLAFVLEGVITQQLIPRYRAKGREMVSEVMVCTPAIKSLIRDDKVHQIYGIMQAGQKYGMQTMNQSLYAAYANKRISYEDAIGRSSDREELLKMIGDSVTV